MQYHPSPFYPSPSLPQTSRDRPHVAALKHSPHCSGLHRSVCCRFLLRFGPQLRGTTTPLLVEDWQPKERAHPALICTWLWVASICGSGRLRMAVTLVAASSWLRSALWCELRSYPAKNFFISFKKPLFQLLTSSPQCGSCIRTRNIGTSWNKTAKPTAAQWISAITVFSYVIAIFYT